jgi:D-proline reductase (dithiol) PrdB
MEHVRYIDKTRDYYRRAGYQRDYGWAQFGDGPFTPLAKPLAQCTVMLVSTASLVMLDGHGRPLEQPRVIGTNDLEVFPVPMDWPPERLRSVSTDHDRFQTDMADVNAYFPLTRLRELLAEGAIGGLAVEALRILPNYSHRKVLRVDAPEVLRRALQQEVDAVVLTPV